MPTTHGIKTHRKRASTRGGEALQQAFSGQSGRDRVAIGGVLIDRIGRAEADVCTAAFVFSRSNHQIATVNTDFVRLAQRDAEFRAILNRSDLAAADGMPMVWLSRIMRRPIRGRVTGFDLIDSCCRSATRAGVGIFLLGAAPGVAEAAGEELRRRYPGLRIAGVYAPPFGDESDAQEARMVNAIRAAGRCVLFVAFGAPKQDRFIARHLAELDTPIAMGVGCAFDVLSGAVARAPRWMQSIGLEWLWRMAREPSRLTRRYLLEDVPFLGTLVARALRDERALSGEAG